MNHFNFQQVSIMNGGNPIMDSLKSKMKEMNLKEDLDRTATVTNENKVTNVLRQEQIKSPGI